MSSAIDKAVANLDDQSWIVREAAVQALGKSPEAVAQHGAAIAQRLEHKDGGVRNAAVQALGTSPEAVAQHGAAIAQRLEDGNWGVRQAAVEALGKSPKAVAQHGAAVAQRLEHKDADVRKAAVTRRRKIYIRLRHFRVAIISHTTHAGRFCGYSARMGKLCAITCWLARRPRHPLSSRCHGARS